MSASDEEAFASAEEGEDGGSEKSKKSSGKVRAKAKGGGKQKGRQKGQQGPGPSKAAISKSKNTNSPETSPDSSTSKQTEEKGASKRVEITPAPTSNLQEPQDTQVTSASSKKDEPGIDSKHLQSESKKESEEKSPVVRASLEADGAQQAKNLEPVSEVEKPTEQAIPRSESGGELEQSAEQAEESVGKSGGWGWGWGSSLLSAATNSLETFSSQVGEGLTTLIDTVESSLGVPDPASIARADSTAELDTEPNTGQTVIDQPHQREAVEKPVKVTKGQEGSAEELEDNEGAGAPATMVEEGEEDKGVEGGGGWLSSLGSNITNMGKTLVNKSQTLMNTGFEKAEHLAAGGLDILETIGKKTYTTITEHDPGLRRAREFLHQKTEKPSLSSVLKDAQERAKQHAKLEEEMEEARRCNFTALFEDNQGLAHLEALEMLSNRCERKVQALLSAMEEDLLETIRPQLVEIKDTFNQAFVAEKEQETAEHDFSKLVTENLSELHLGAAPDKLNKVQETVRQWIADFYSHEDHSEIASAKDVQQRAIQSLADVTAKTVEQFHKAGELVLLQKDEDKTFLHRAQSLAKLASVLVAEVDILATKFSQCLSKIGEEKCTAEEVTPMVTSVYLEAGNASSYIQDAFQLLLPVLQHAAIQATLTSSL